MKILAISNNEICHNPRLIKACDFMSSRGCDITIYNPILGIADPELYSAFIAERDWNIIEYDISKRSLLSRAKWGIASAAQAVAEVAWRSGIPWRTSLYQNKGLIGAPQLWGEEFDIIVVNLVDNLPFASFVKHLHQRKPILVYDSQEFFPGQYENKASSQLRWICEAESHFIDSADVILGTTDVMVDRIKKRHDINVPSFRVRNVPYKQAQTRERLPSRSSDAPLRCIWHGFRINYEGRGVNIILDAVAQCESKIYLTLQGNISTKERDKIERVCRNSGILSHVTIREAAHPEHIIQSIYDQDIGISAEPGKDTNQILTSSNKLFDYIHAGLAVCIPDLPGLIETVDDLGNGLVYSTGSSEELADCLDRLAQNREMLRTLRKRSIEAAPALTWKEDYEPVWDCIHRLFESRVDGVARPSNPVEGSPA